MKIRNLGRTGLKVSNLCLGAMTFGNAEWGCDESESRKIVDRFLDFARNPQLEPRPGKLDELIGEEMKDDLFPAAASLARPEGQMLGYPFALWNLTHAAAANETFGESIPTTWNDLLDTDDLLP